MSRTNTAKVHSTKNTMLPDSSLSSIEEQPTLLAATQDRIISPDGTPGSEAFESTETVAPEVSVSDGQLAPERAKNSSKFSSHSGTALQDMFLNGLRRENIDVVVYFCDGSQERGSVRAFDTFTILLENRGSGKVQLVYKHSIARIFPTRSPSQLAIPGRGARKP
jgi:host factor-I protein